MVEAIIGAIFVDCGGVTSIVTSVIYNLLENELGKACIFLVLLRMTFLSYPNSSKGSLPRGGVGGGGSGNCD